MSRRKPSQRDLNLIAKRGKGISGKISKDLRTKINNATRRAMADIMNDLAERGPRYGGSFADSWRAIPVGNEGGKVKDGEYPYTIENVPTIPSTVKATQRVVVFTIDNIADYAPVALDLEPGKFIDPGYEPMGGIEFKVVEGRRYGPMRGQVAPAGSGGDVNLGSRKSNISTAEQDWYSTYAGGGDMDAVVARVFRYEFRAGS